MLVIRNDQLAVFKQSAEDAFVVEMCAHCRAFAPELCATLDAGQLHDAVRFAMAQAKTQGFDQRGPVQSFIDMMILFGAGFCQDPQYPWIAQLLAEPGSTRGRSPRWTTRACGISSTMPAIPAANAIDCGSYARRHCGPPFAPRHAREQRGPGRSNPLRSDRHSARQAVRSTCWMVPGTPFSRRYTPVLAT